MKRRIALITVLCLVMAMLSGCGMPSSTGKVPFEVTMEEAFIANTYDGEALAVNLNIVNQSKEYIMGGMIAYQIEATLDGKSLTPGYLPSDSVNYVNADSNVAAGETGETQAVFVLNGETEGEVVIKGITQTDNGKMVEFLNQTINLADIEKKVVASEYALAIDNVIKTDDGDGNDIIVIDLTYTNNATKPSSFGSAINLQLFQNGTGLQRGYLPYNHPAHDEKIEDNSYLEAQAGATLQVRAVYILNDETSPVEVKAEDHMNYDKEMILETEIKLDGEVSGDELVAGSVDTASKFAFTVDEAIIGLSNYDEVPIVVLAGSFTNNSDEAISFSWALDATATQDGYTLKDAYLSGSGDYNYNDIAPGKTIPIFIGWEILDDENDITLTVVDNQHYAKEEVYSQTFTIDELIKNTEGYADADDVIEKTL